MKQESINHIHYLLKSFCKRKSCAGKKYKCLFIIAENIQVGRSNNFIYNHIHERKEMIRTDRTVEKEAVAFSGNKIEQVQRASFRQGTIMVQAHINTYT